MGKYETTLSGAAITSTLNQMSMIGDIGKEILINSGFPIKPVDTMEQAAQDVVKMVEEKR